MYLYFGNVFPESHGFVAVPVPSWNNFVEQLDMDKFEHVSLVHLVAGISTKP